MDKRAQWKALRANVWAERAKVKFHHELWKMWMQTGLAALSHIAPAGVPSVLDLSKSPKAKWLRRIAEMRAAEREGMDPVLWKLTHG